MHSLHRLDVMVAYSCNIGCRGCISISDVPRKGTVTTDEVKSWCDHWSPYLTPTVLTIFGGEPLMNRQILSICQILRQAWPKSTLRLITNGYLLSNFDPDAWFQFGPFEMQVSIHRADHEKIINQHIKKILENFKDWKTIRYQDDREHKQIEFRRPDFSLWKSKFKDFVTPYKLSNGTMMPFKGDPVKSHQICGSPNTPILYKGKLYKCPPVANLIDVTGQNWSGYVPCSDPKDLEEFVSHVGVPESVCAQCPDNINLHTYDHMALENVTVKKIPN